MSDHAPPNVDLEDLTLPSSRVSLGYLELTLLIGTPAWTKVRLFYLESKTRISLRLGTTALPTVNLDYIDQARGFPTPSCIQNVLLGV